MTTEERLLERVRKLLDLAEHPNTPEAEAETARSQANKLITKHAIDEALLRAAQSSEQRRKPIVRDISVSWDLYELAPHLRSIAAMIAQYNRCRSARVSGSVRIFGFSEDVDWVEMLYTSAYAALVTYLRPKWDNSKGYDENVYNFKVAGYAWKDINHVAVQNGQKSAEALKTVYSWREGCEIQVPSGKMGSRLIAAYKRHAKKIGDTNPVATQSFEHFRRSYIEGFVQRLDDRLYRLWQESKSQASASGAELVLADAMTAVNEAFWAEFPNQHPEAVEAARARQREANMQAIRERHEMLDGMTEKQRIAFLEKEERQRERQYRRSDRYYEDLARHHDSSSAARGAAAADRINLSRATRVSTEGRRGIDG